MELARPRPTTCKKYMNYRETGICTCQVWPYFRARKKLSMLKTIAGSSSRVLKNILILGMMAFAGAAFSQKMAIKKMELVNDQMVVHYEIDDSNPSNEYLVTIFTSKDNYAAPLIKVSGDVGAEVRPGMRKAVWNIREEFGDYEGPLSLELRANVFIPFVKLRSFVTAKGYKRGKAYKLDWRPGNTNPVHIELFRENSRMQGELNHPNNGSYTVNFSSDLKPGSGYKLKITDSKRPDDFIYTIDFKVKRKIPLLLKVIPIFAGGYLVATQLTSGEDENSLPNPPSAPEQ